ncbi:wiskott-Aldrich syndrome protein homolog 1-like [Zingiber officinale]|uniref:wiskott-Aldrich syndrome protein homolog 1-like n=1 Tax=Zingiber officinale TaxID=94328 RepID=UPI001C4D5506|nr:wiskott-Aldrich syndrome protein homolog 1-like [Zingiber officinale]
MKPPELSSSPLPPFSGLTPSTPPRRGRFHRCQGEIRAPPLCMASSAASPSGVASSSSSRRLQPPPAIATVVAGVSSAASPSGVASSSSSRRLQPPPAIATVVAGVSSAASPPPLLPALPGWVPAITASSRRLQPPPASPAASGDCYSRRRRLQRRLPLQCRLLHQQPASPVATAASGDCHSRRRRRQKHPTPPPLPPTLPVVGAGDHGEYHLQTTAIVALGSPPMWIRPSGRCISLFILA